MSVLVICPVMHIGVWSVVDIGAYFLSRVHDCVSGRVMCQCGSDVL